MIGTGYIDALDLAVAGLLRQILEDPGPFMFPKSLAWTALFSSLRLGASLHPHFPASHLISLSLSFWSLH